jgi:hypothetical protein
MVRVILELSFMLFTDRPPRLSAPRSAVIYQYLQTTALLMAAALYANATDVILSAGVG